jgi:hypothetical protein
MVGSSFTASTDRSSACRDSRGHATVPEEMVDGKQAVAISTSERRRTNPSGAILCGTSPRRHGDTPRRGGESVGGSAYASRPRACSRRPRPPALSPWSEPLLTWRAERCLRSLRATIGDAGQFQIGPAVAVVVACLPRRAAPTDTTANAIDVTEVTAALRAIAATGVTTTVMSAAAWCFFLFLCRWRAQPGSCGETSARWSFAEGRRRAMG